MITQYEITNFKAFSGPESIPIKPITLIFGPNSSGKSSLLQSLLLLKQTMNDTQKTVPLVFKGDLTDLGNYRELVYRHDMENSFSVRVTVQKAEALTSFFNYYSDQISRSDFTELEESLRETQNIGMKISFSRPRTGAGVAISSMELFPADSSSPAIKYEPFGFQNLSENDILHTSISSEDFAIGRRMVLAHGINEEHPYWAQHWMAMQNSEVRDIEDLLRKSPEDREALIVLNKILPDERWYDFREEWEGGEAGYFGELVRTVSDWRGLKRFELAKKAYQEIYGGDSLLLNHFLPDELNSADPFSAPEYMPAVETRNPSLLMLIIAAAFKSFLENIAYIGPSRINPERYFTFTGTAADYVGKSGNFVPDMLVGNRQLLDKINEHFARLNLDYELRLSSLSDPDCDVHDVFALRLYSKSTEIHVGITDVGYGLSQILPVIVQSLLVSRKTILIEQPELHLHPALQAELGDVFIESALGERNNSFMIETHSEHLLLRVMRRIRETFHGKLPEGLPQVRPQDVAVLYVGPDGAKSIIKEMPVNERGELMAPWPGGFFEEDFEELF